MIYQGDGCRLKVGIPRGLLFYRFYAYWTTFLKELDQVAYVRFASVYREFRDIDQFMEILTTLKTGEKQ